MFDPDATPRRTPGLLLLPLLLLASGSVLLGLGLGRAVPLVEVHASGWGARLLLIKGALLLGYGARGLVRFLTGRLPTYRELRARRHRELWMAPMLLVGVTLPLLLVLDPMIDRLHVQRGHWLLVLIGLLCLVLWAVGMWNPDRTIRALRLARGEGVRGRAVVDDYHDTGVTINDHPRVRLELTVTLDGRESYRVQHTEAVPRLAIGRLVRGASLPVLVDREVNEQLIVLWKEP